MNRPQNIFYFYILIIFLIPACITVELQDQYSRISHKKIFPSCISGNCKDGFGIRRDRNGIYIGYWKDGNPNGEGTYIYDNGKKYIGHWRYNLQHGEGKLIQKNGIWYGRWTDGEISGECRFESDEATFKGTINRHPFNYYYYPVKGEIVWKDGSTFRGNFACINSNYGMGQKDCGVPFGEGEFISNTGIHVKGQFSSSIEKVFFKPADFRNNHKHTGFLKSDNGSYKYQLLINIDDNPIIFKFINVVKE